MKAHFFITIAFCIIHTACQNFESEQNSAVRPAEQANMKAAKMTPEGNCDSSLVVLEHAFAEGLQPPMGIISDSNFYSLIDHPDCRQQVRELLKAYATESTATMVRQNEPGTRISVTGEIVDEADGLPIEHVVVELVHADSHGQYFSEKSAFNPRLFAYLSTDRNGAFTINTIRPGTYLDDDGNPVPSHIHFTLEKSGYRLYASEFTFDDDPIFKANGNVDMVPVAIKDNQNHYTVEIKMQREQ